MKINIIRNNLKIWAVAGAVVVSLLSIQIIDWVAKWVM
jgi:hypothetical protein